MLDWYLGVAGNFLDEVNPEDWAKWLQKQGLDVQLTIFFFLFPSLVFLTDTQGNITETVGVKEVAKVEKLAAVTEQDTDSEMTTSTETDNTTGNDDISGNGVRDMMMMFNVKVNTPSCSHRQISNNLTFVHGWSCLNIHRYYIIRKSWRWNI